MTAMKSDVEIRQFVIEERQKSVSEREWQFRLRGYGFGISDNGKRRYVVSLINKNTLCELSS